MARRATALRPDTSWRDGPIQDPRIGLGNVLPPSWADGRFVPQPGARCGCCGLTWFSRGTSGWVCCTCHPMAPGQKTEIVDTRDGG